MSSKIKQFIIGLVVGVIGLAAGTTIFALVFSKINSVSLTFIKNNFDIIVSSGPMQMMTGALILNFLLFYIFMRKKTNMIAQGVMIISIIALIASLLY